MRLFVSYAHEDNAIVKDWIVDKLLAGGHEVWFDARLVAGQDWKQQLDAEIERSDALIYALTPESIASEWCQWELARAVKLGKPVIPVLMQARAKIPDTLSQLQYVDFSSGPTGDAIARLMGGLQHLSPMQVPSPPSDPQGYPAQVEEYVSQRRKLEAAMPACTQYDSETKLKIKISLPGSLGLRAELPEVLPSGDTIQQSDVRSSNFQLRIPIDSQTGQLHPGNVCIEIRSDHFTIKAIGAQRRSCSSDQYQLTVPPRDDSPTINFVLVPVQVREQSKLATVYILLYQDGELVAETYVETQLVTSMDQLPICGNWRLQVAMLKWSTGGSLVLPMKILRDPAWQAVIGVIGIIVTIGIAFITLNTGSESSANPTMSATPATPVVVASRNLDIRSGPGAEFNRIGVLAAEDSLDIRGITEDGLWYQVLLADGTYGWVLAAESFGRFIGNRSVLTIVTLTATSTATPTSTSSPSSTPTNSPTFTPSPTTTPTATPRLTSTLTSTPEPSETLTSAPEPPATIPSVSVTLTYTTIPTTVIRAYPCEANIVSRNPSSLTLQIIYRVPSTSIMPAGSIQQGTSIILLERLMETPGSNIFFSVADSSGSRLGWILDEYVVPSTNCPSSGESP